MLARETIECSDAHLDLIFLQLPRPAANDFAVDDDRRAKDSMAGRFVVGIGRIEYSSAIRVADRVFVIHRKQNAPCFRSSALRRTEPPVLAVMVLAFES